MVRCIWTSVHAVMRCAVKLRQQSSAPSSTVAMLPDATPRTTPCRPLLSRKDTCRSRYSSSTVVAAVVSTDTAREAEVEDQVRPKTLLRTR